MDELPIEISYNIILHLPVKDIGNILLLNKKFNNICSGDYFWKLKTIVDYHTLKNNCLSWKEMYKKCFLGCLRRRDSLIRHYEECLDKIIGGIDPHIILNVSFYDKFYHTNVRILRSFIPTARSTMVIPKVLINGKYINLPISYQKERKNNFYDFFKEIVNNSTYANITDNIFFD